MAAMTTQLTSLPPSVLGGKIDPNQEPRSPKSSDAVDARQAPGVASQESTEATPPSIEELQETVARINEHMQVERRNLQFNLDEESGHTVVKVINSDTEELIRQFPSEDLLQFSRNFQEYNQDSIGSLFKAEA